MMNKPDNKGNIVSKGFKKIPLNIFFPKKNSGLDSTTNSNITNYDISINEREEVKKILENHGTNSNDYFKLWPDKFYFFSKTRQSVISYKAENRIAISFGDPVGPDNELEELLQNFIEFCKKKKYSPVFHQVMPNILPLYKKIDLSEVKIGEEAIIDINKFLTSTINEDDFKRIYKKFNQQGYEVTELFPPHSHDILDIIDLVSKEWLSLPGRKERTFTLGYFDRDYINTTPIFILRNPEKKIIAFANRIPSYAKDEATIDLMRHRLDIPNGTMDFLFIKIMEIVKEDGFSKFSLGLAPMVGVGDEPGASVEEYAMRGITNRLNKIFAFKGLKMFKSKFDPVWEDSHLIYTGGPYGLLRAALALASVTRKTKNITFKK